MPDSLLYRRGSSHKMLYLLGLVFGGCLILVILVAYGLARLTSQKIQESRELTYVAPVTTTDHVKKALLRRHTDHGDEILEILEDGTVNLYDANMRLIKSGLQGFGRLTNLFKNFDDLLKAGNRQFVCPIAYQLTLVTSLGTYTCTPPEANQTLPGTDDLIDEFEDMVDDTFAPTPTYRPTNTPAPTTAPGYPTATPAPFVPTPRVTDPDWNPLTPTPLPEYMLAPPFSCSDYHLNHPFTISNVICGAD